MEGGEVHKTEKKSKCHGNTKQDDVFGFEHSNVFALR